LQPKNADAAPTKDYVNEFFHDHSGAKYKPHVTYWAGPRRFIKKLLAKPYRKFTFHCSAASIYHLGILERPERNYGVMSNRYCSKYHEHVSFILKWMDQQERPVLDTSIMYRSESDFKVGRECISIK